MNVNENVHPLGRGKGRAPQLKVVPIQRTMDAPKCPAPKRREPSTSTYTTSSSFNINWKPRQNSGIQNNSTTVRTATSSRSHSSSEPESRVVIALSEGRGEAAGEVGIAAINIARPSLILCQISDTQSYVSTLTKINILNPNEILIPLTFVESFPPNRLIEKVKEQFCDVKITGVTRSTFNKTTGLQYVKQLCVSAMNSVLLTLQHRYYALAAAAALLTYTERTLFVSYASESIKVEYQEAEGSTIIDVATADRLELVACARPTMKKRFSCLLDVLNHCQTKIGVRTLRASILQPPCSVSDIEARLDCVTELIEHSDMLAAVQAVLSMLANIDQLLTLATVLPDQAQNCSERQLNYILLLNTTLEQIQPLRDIFENTTQGFFIELRATLGNPLFRKIKEVVRKLIHSEAHRAKGQNGIIQRCFAIKSGINGLLDLVRKSYSERVDDMSEYVKVLGGKYNLALTLNNNNKKGYHIVLALNAHQKKTLKKTDLPSEFIQVERLCASYTMKTDELINLSHRVEDIMLEILKMSNIMIYKLLIYVREHIGIFYKLCEDVAKLDMLQSLAKASQAMHYVRPQFADYLEVTRARHPLLDFLCSVAPTENAMYASKDYNMNIITGPNGSGKSIFIRQVVLIQVMAQVGCYVPAESATLRVSDRILARVYLEDNMDCGASAFVLEMKEIQYFLTVLTNNTLIIIDELCRSTSVEEGTALAMAICERFMKTPAFVFFTTHFKLLTNLRDLHFNVKTWQLETLTETINDRMVLHFTYNVIPGVTNIEHYGMFLAKACWPEDAIRYAEETLGELSKQKLPSPRVEQTNAAARLKYDLEAELRMLKAKKQLTRAVINEKLTKYQRDLADLGHLVEIPMFSNATVENYQSTVPEPNFEYERQTEINPDYFNLQGQENDDVELQNLSAMFTNRTLRANVSAICKNTFEGFHFANTEVPGIFNNTRDTSNGSYERDRLLHPENVEFHSPACARFNDSRDFSFNIFEPEVILGTSREVSVNPQESYSLQEVVRTETPPVARRNSFMAPFRGNSLASQHSITFQANSCGSVESYGRPREELSYSENCNREYEQTGSIYEDALSSLSNNRETQKSVAQTEHFFVGNRNEAPYENTLFNRQTEFLNPQTGNLHNNSFLSINELQFSLPLQQNMGRTSTPVHFGSQVSNFNQSNIGDVFVTPTTLATPKVFGQYSKCSSSSASGVHWGVKANKPNNLTQQTFRNSQGSSGNLQVAPSTSQTKNKSSSNQSNSNVDSVGENAKNNKKSSTSNTNSKTSTDSLIWKTGEKESKNTSTILEINLLNTSSSRYCSDAELTEVINDLQSCSEYFSSESQDWDCVNENVNSKPNPEKVTIDNVDESKEIKERENRNLEEGLKTVDETTQTLQILEIFKNPETNNPEVLNNDINLDPTDVIEKAKEKKIQINHDIQDITKTEKKRKRKPQSASKNIKHLKKIPKFTRKPRFIKNRNTRTRKAQLRGANLNLQTTRAQDIKNPIERAESKLEETPPCDRDNKLHGEVCLTKTWQPRQGEESCELKLNRKLEETPPCDREKNKLHGETWQPQQGEESRENKLNPQSPRSHLNREVRSKSRTREEMLQMLGCVRVNQSVLDESSQEELQLEKTHEERKDKEELSKITPRNHSSHELPSKTISDERNLEEPQFSSKTFSDETNTNEQIEVEKSHQKLSDESSLNAKQISLEPLGDIHLELFSDDSIVENSQEVKVLSLIESGCFSKPPSDKRENQTDAKKSKNSPTAGSNLAQQSRLSPSLQITDDNSDTNNNKRELSQTNDASSQKPKRRRSGYVAKRLEKSSTSVQTIEQQREFSKENSPQKQKAKRTPKFKPPFKKDVDVNKQELLEDKNLQHKVVAKFKTLEKLTKKEIEREYYEQDKKALESADPSRYLTQIINRPSFKQLQQTKHIASIRKTGDGVVVVPAKQRTAKSRKAKFVTPLKGKSENFDVTLFSDKNSDKFEQFMNSNNNETKSTVRYDTGYIQSETVTKINRETSFSEFGKEIQNLATASCASYNEDENILKKDYYTQNQKSIDDLVDKYLKPDLSSAVAES